jgi:hypothetical protein
MRLLETNLANEASNDAKASVSCESREKGRQQHQPFKSMDRNEKKNGLVHTDVYGPMVP